MTSQEADRDDPYRPAAASAPAGASASVQALSNFVNGRRVAAADGQASDIIDPSTGEACARAPVSGRAGVDAGMRAAASAFETWRDTTPAERSLALLRIADAVQARGEELVAAECRNTG